MRSNVLAIFAPSVLVLLWKKLKSAGKAATDYLEELDQKAEEKLEMEEKAKRALEQITNGVENIKKAHPELKEEMKEHLRQAQTDPEVERIVDRVKNRSEEIF